MEPFVVRYTVPLGGNGPVREVNAPYVASFTLQPPMPEPEVSWIRRTQTNLLQ